MAARERAAVTGLPRDLGWRFENARAVTLTSEPTDRYNCFAYAAGDESRNWDPFGGYWPASAPRARSVPALIAAFAPLGYAPCADGRLTPDVEKVAVDVKLRGSRDPAEVTHAARQLSNGRWTSKIGGHVDVEHDLDDLRGETYGYPLYFLARPRTTTG